jgi:diguanylate cyclase (GGDEF)-like protein/PAS domain S-box-containing protein
MTKKLPKSANLDTLRGRAEQRREPASKKTIAALTRQNIAEIFHDLETHQIELEMQNEDLIRIQNELIEVRDQYTELYDFAPVGYFTTDNQNKITRCNLTLVEMLNLSIPAILNKQFTQFIDNDSQDVFYLNRRQLFSDRGIHSCELRLKVKPGRDIWVRMDSINVQSPKSEPDRIRSVLIDITTRKKAEEELRKLTRAMEFSSSAIIITDLKGIIEYVNPIFYDMSGYTKHESIGKDLRLLQSDGSLDSTDTTICEAIVSRGQWKGDTRNRKKDGSFYWARDSISTIKDAQGKTTHYVDIQDDITHEYELEKQLSFQATHDLLTGLINRQEFERRAQRLLASMDQDPQQHALCYMNLDQFKIINDTCGHAAGDELLRQLSRVLQDTVRPIDTLGRLGGDEFGVLIHYCSQDQDLQAATTLREAIQDYLFYWEGRTFRVGVSIGLVAIADNEHSLSELLNHANAACYMAKELGRNRIHLFRDEDIVLAQRHGEMQWVARINHALDENRFCIYAQPIEPLDNSQSKHYELLLRMFDEDGKIVPPDAFLPAAERYNLIGKIDLWVINHVFALLEAHPDFVAQTSFFSTNLSGHSLNNPELLEIINSKLRSSKIPAEKICFEITETVAISNLNAAIKFISILRKAGFRFALDDFGSGLSSFSYLKNLPVDFLKIDGIFVKDIANDRIDYAMVKSINEIGQVMGMQTIAEYVENDEIKGMLKAIGVNYAQGYGIGKPRPFMELLSA